MDLGVPETARSLAGPEDWTRRTAGLTAPHHAPLHGYVRGLQDQLTARQLSVPHLDPLGGGVASRVLYLLEAPGPMAMAARGGSGFVSLDNRDPTARTLFDLTQAVGLSRHLVLTWNIVPWYVGDAGRIRAVRAGEVEEGRAHLRELLGHLPQLSVVVTFGRPAARGWRGLAEAYPAVTTLATWHPSGQALNGHPERREHVRATLILARQLIGMDPSEAAQHQLFADWQTGVRGPGWARM